MGNQNFDRSAIANEGWVTDPDDVTNWVNGLKWLSKAIVSDNDHDDRNQLKERLFAHLGYAALQQEKEIRAEGFFYILAWKRIDLLKDYPFDDGFELLKSSLTRLYENLELRAFKLLALDGEGWELALEVLDDLLQKRLHPAEEHLLSEGLAGARPEVAFSVLDGIAEAIQKLKINIDQYQILLRAFWKKHEILIGDYLAIGELRRARDYFIRIKAVNPLFLSLGIDHTSLLRRYLDLLHGRDLEEGVLIALDLRSSAGFEKAIREFWPAKAGVLISLLRKLFSARLLGQEDFELVFGMLKTEAEARELLSLCLDPQLETPLLARAVEEGLDDPAHQDEVFKASGVVLHLFGIKKSPLLKARIRFLSREWERVTTQSDPKVWRAGFSRFEDLSLSSGDDLIESEYFLPLLKSALLSSDPAIYRLVIDFTVKRPQLKGVMESWLSEPQFQNDLVAGLSSLQVKSQIWALNKLLILYCRYPIRAPYILKRIERYDERVSGAELERELKDKISRANQRLKQVLA